MKKIITVDLEIDPIQDLLKELDGTERSIEEAEKYFDMLSENTKWTAYQWGTYDSVFRDEAYTEFNKILFLRGVDITEDWQSGNASGC